MRAGKLYATSEEWLSQTTENCAGKAGNHYVLSESTSAHVFHLIFEVGAFQMRRAEAPWHLKDAMGVTIDRI